ncbi:nucleobase:cation symporter-1, NCS1 family [Peptoclostridium litorale DSM 5388]|uniref:Transporter n=1 Tax=Peptoclostridium litorale DSM 5388 TaxID=1121324 RepID=A0A069RH21_PEPLI|nr:NCS1 family transporter [Peptoclostridium litorale]KDR96306.1 transporter [Peptoclostridium litorale DSM 5388]SIO26082.1 nucleobase:cation symporter-1, NCS1 family [Peptoclostridium litorale DSM 5388]
MEDIKGVNNQVDDTLCPIPDDKRMLSSTSYLFAWLGGCVSIGTFSLGASLVAGGLNLMQSALAIALGSLLLVVCLVINDKLCYTTGVPYVVQLRSAFGMNGTIFPALIRAVPAVVWYGFQSWLGGSALNEVSKTLFGYDNMILFFIGFQIFQILLSLLGFKGVKWLENIGAVFIILALTYMFYVVFTQYGDVISTKLIHIEGSWGLPFWGAVTSFFGVNTAVMLNCGDYARELKKGYSNKKRAVVYLLSMLPPTLFMGMIGLMISVATGIMNPVVAFSTAVDNKILVVMTLGFIIFAQITTNLLSNVIPPVYALVDIFKIKYRTSAVTVGLLAFCTFPWKLIRPESASGLDLFVLTYTAFIGPVFAVLTVDYYLLRKQKISLNELYNADGAFKGTNYAALVAVFIGAACAFIQVKLAFFMGSIPAGLAYYVLMKRLPISKPFTKGTVFEQAS